ncbi:hypothetical protein J5N97_024740 [Dioscorea zingiberensis]|uniref:DUF6817 domain-containing protein n=1 Tax=Dioscorea zingiberensis TaxID=325984 RepID=A0A9D5C7P8_9LILI|nr:hypothetical protein J5N97_024740 [Dioscorea zingiberensis]
MKSELSDILGKALPFLRGELHAIDPDLPKLVSLLRAAGAGECWHKDGCFMSHLTDVYRILKLWGAPDPIARCGLYHSVYSNSYVNLALFDAKTDGRETLRSLIGADAERLVHLFCIVPRQPLIHDDLIFLYSDDELIDHLRCSESSLVNLRNSGISIPNEPWRQKLQSVLPPQGIKVKHIITGEEVKLSRRMVAAFVLMTMADFSDQLYSFQDDLFNNENGRLEFTGNNFMALWPGDGRPGLWMNSISRMGAVYNLIVREEEMYIEERSRMASGDHHDENGIIDDNNDRDEDMALVIPPVFEYCTEVLGTEEQKVARDLYWEAVSCRGMVKAVEEKLKESCAKNRFVGEPFLVLGQVYASTGRFEEAEKVAGEGLRLIMEWGSSWDKRMSWEGWVAWGRLVLMNAKNKTWPHTSWGILNLGLVR